jgi:hypothetical protein
VHHQYRDVDALEVFAEVGLGEGDDAIVVRLGAAHHALAPPVQDHPFVRFRPRPVVAVERPGGHIVEELRAVGRDLGLEPSNTDFGRPPGLPRSAPSAVARR